MVSLPLSLSLCVCVRACVRACVYARGWAGACAGGVRFSNINRIIPSDYRILLLLKMPIPNIYIYIYISAVKVNMLITQIPFNGTNFINARLTQRIFSV